MSKQDGEPFSRILRAVAAMNSGINALLKFHVPPQRWQLERLASESSRVLNRMFAAVDGTLSSTRETFRLTSGQDAQASLVKKGGWIPHRVRRLIVSRPAPLRKSQQP